MEKELIQAIKELKDEIVDLKGTMKESKKDSQMIQGIGLVLTFLATLVAVGPWVNKILNFLKPYVEKVFQNPIESGNAFEVINMLVSLVLAILVNRFALKYYINLEDKIKIQDSVRLDLMKKKSKKN